MFGAGTRRLFLHVLLPLLVPGILAALLLVLVRTIAMFELTFLTAGPDQPDAGGRALLRGVRRRRARARSRSTRWRWSTWSTTLVWLLIALRFVNPTQIVSPRQGAPAAGMNANGIYAAHFQPRGA